MGCDDYVAAFTLTWSHSAEVFAEDEKSGSAGDHTRREGSRCGALRRADPQAFHSPSQHSFESLWQWPRAAAFKILLPLLPLRARRRRRRMLRTVTLALTIRRSRL